MKDTLPYYNNFKATNREVRLFIVIKTSPIQACTHCIERALQSKFSIWRLDIYIKMHRVDKRKTK